MYGRLTTTAVEPIIDSLYALLLNHKTLKSRITDLSVLLKDLVKPNSMTELHFLI